ncbi:amino acid ABC transporter substrate-binding protein, PAAT family [Actinacidiphila alni]|uniref:Amino acid ABC transporter substrate-binding protein, PAAT family n=1 Tax=Actinacidiphila alni TaxID=380248 RepID=A0A1I2AI84_9ACTN|nr:ABC transporter substrate-binding protein [Actinacidiphila alni]SFE43715.1 amino acid ABC transporter substrate-binding protein, PAAT family [Actinacidiphila alni]
MTTERRPARRLPRPLAATTATVLAAALGLALLTACGDSSDSAGTSDSSASDAAAGGASPKAAGSPGAADPESSTAIPTEDVVSGVTADPALAAELPAAARSSHTLTLGTTRAPGTTGLPHGGEDAKGTPIGLDVDLRDAVGKVLGITWKVQYGTFPTVIPGVQNGRYDVGQDNFGVTKAREQVVDFATYLNDGQSFLGAKDVPVDSVTALTDLCGLTVATSPGSTFQQILTDGASKCAGAGKKPYKVQYFTDTAPIFLGLANGKVDVFFGPTLGLKYDATHVPNTKFLGEISTTPVGFVTAKGSPVGKALSDAVNKLIADGTYAKIFAKWGVPGTGITKSEVNPAATF